MKNSTELALVIVAFISCSAFADGGLELAKEKQCLDCHAIDKTTLGPSFQDIAKKYKGMKGSVIEGDLITQIMSGNLSEGSYHWGYLQMPSQRERSHISDAEAKSLLDWILNLE